MKELDESKNLGKRDQTKVMNRQQILEAAKNLFSDKGFEATNVRDIIHESQLSPGTFYNYFQSKEEIFEVLTEEVIHDVRAQVKLAYHVGRLTPTELRLAFVNFFNVFSSNPRLMKFLSRNQSYLRELRNKGRFDGILQDLEENLARAVKEGMLPALHVKIVSIAVFGAVFEIIATMVVTPHFDIPQAIETLSSFFTVQSAK